MLATAASADAFMSIIGYVLGRGNVEKYCSLENRREQIVLGSLRKTTPIWKTEKMFKCYSFVEPICSNAMIFLVLLEETLGEYS